MSAGQGEIFREERPRSGKLPAPPAHGQPTNIGLLLRLGGKRG